MVTASPLPHLIIATIFEFEMSDGRTARVTLDKFDARELAKTLGNKAIGSGRRKATALNGSVQVSVAIGDAK